MKQNATYKRRRKGENMYPTKNIDIGIARLIDTKTLCKYLSLGRHSAVAFARKIGADRKIGNRLLFDRTILDQALKEL